MPKRVRREYYKKLPPNTKSVTRPHKYGNSLKLKDGKIHILSDDKKEWFVVCDGDIDKVLNLFKAILNQDVNLVRNILKGKIKNAWILNSFNFWLNHFSKLDYSKLKGKDLACFCKLEDKCHADILLDFINNR